MSTEHRESDLIRSWLDETYGAERNPHDYLDHLLDEVPTTPQHTLKLFLRAWALRSRQGRAATARASALHTESRSREPR